METLQGFPYYPVEFAKDGQVFQQSQVEALLAGLKQQPVSDLLVLSHGWNNDMHDARSLYDTFLAQLKKVMAAKAVPGVAGRAFAVLGVLWPSKKFADTNLIPSGAAGISSPVTTTALAAALNSLHGVFDAPGADKALDEAKKLLPMLEDSPAARGKFADLLRSVLPPTEKSVDVDLGSAFRSMPGRQVMEQFAKPFPAAGLPTTIRPTGANGHKTEGHVAGLGQLFGGIKAGALNLLNYTTYYQMKERAGNVGRDGLHGVLKLVRSQSAVKMHLVGHSFGGRVVTAAAAGPDGPLDLTVSTLTLLQAAFSHYGFSDNYDGSKAGFFRKVLQNKAVTGPILISHSVNDSAVGTMYPLASMLARQVGAGLGDSNDKYGGMGRNGAQKTPEASEGPLLNVGGKYTFASGKIYNLNGDAVIQEHSDIAHAEVAYALLQAVATT